MFSLSGKTVVVTGATGALGGACCKALAEEGASVFATGRSEEKLGSLGCPSILADLNTEGGRSAFVEEAPLCDGLIFAHGVSGLSPAKFLAAEAIEKMVNTNMTTCLASLALMLRKKRLRPGSSVVFIASVAALKGTVANTIYAASKGALVAATRSLALELARQQIRVNAICPGWIESGLTEELSESISRESYLKETERYPLGPGRPEDVAAASCFLISDAARWITGTALPVDGGYSCQ